MHSLSLAGAHHHDTEKRVNRKCVLKSREIRAGMFIVNTKRPVLHRRAIHAPKQYVTVQTYQGEYSLAGKAYMRLCARCDMSSNDGGGCNEVAPPLNRLIIEGSMTAPEGAR